MTLPTRRRFLSALWGAALPMVGRASDFPSKPVSILIAYPPGGPADLIARTVADIMARRMGQPVIVQSRPGAGGQIAARGVLQAPADGHTLLLGDTATLATNPSLFKDFGYEPLVDFDPVAPLLIMPMALFVPQSSPFESFEALVNASRNRPLNYASQGVGSTGHLLGESLRLATGGQFNHVPYKGSSPAMADLMGGHVDLLFDGVGPGLPHVLGQRIRALALAGPARLPQLPGVQTTASLGYPAVSMSLWFGMVARAGTPAPCLHYLHEEVQYALALPSAAKRFEDLGFLPMPMTQKEFAKFMKVETEKWGAFIKARRIALD